MCNKIKVISEVFEGLEAVRNSGKTNMFDINAVASIAMDMKYYHTALWVSDPANKKQYANGILKGFTPVTE